MENIRLYTDKYDEEFEPHLRPFTQGVWGLLMKVSRTCDTQRLVVDPTLFTNTLSKRVWYANKPVYPHLLGAVVLLPRQVFASTELR